MFVFRLGALETRAAAVAAVAAVAVDDGEIHVARWMGSSVCSDLMLMLVCGA